MRHIAAEALSAMCRRPFGRPFGLRGLAAASTGPVGVVILLVIAVVVSMIEVTEEQQVKAVLDGMDAENTQAQENPPNLEGLVTIRPVS